MSITITPLLRRRIDALTRVSTGVYRNRTRSFILSMEKIPPGGTVTPRQALLIERLAWQFRRQMPPALVPANEPPPFEPLARPVRRGRSPAASRPQQQDAPAPLPLFEWAS
jgi:hypothetical protein